MSEHGWPGDPLGEHGFGDPADPADPADSTAGLGDYHPLGDGYGDHPVDHSADYDEHEFGAADGWSDAAAEHPDAGPTDGYWHDYTDGPDSGHADSVEQVGHVDHVDHVDPGSADETVHSLHGAEGADGAGEVADGPSEDGPLLDSEHLAQPVDAETFPPHLELDVTPTDGREWVDVDLLGSGEEWGTMSMTDSTTDPMGGVVVPDSPQALLADLHQFDGGDGMPSWTTVAGSDDPAVRALALHWQGH